MYFSRLCKYSFVIALGSFPLSASFAGPCSNSEILKIYTEKGDYRGALRHLGYCLNLKGIKPSADDRRLFDELLKQVLAIEGEVYRNFQSVLKNHYILRELEFKLASDFKKHPKNDAKLFSEVRQANEKYYFYHDTGRMLSHARGIALTDKSLIWKNLAGKQHRLAFDEIKSMTLVYDRSYSLNSNLSLTGWRVRVNDNKNNDIRLSRVPAEAIEPFVSAVAYFINFNKTSPDKKGIPLKVPEREKAILAGWKTLCGEKLDVEANIPASQHLQSLEDCFSTKYGDNFKNEFKLSQTDSELLNKFTTQIFAKTDTPFAKGYENFKIMLSTHFFSDLDIKFKKDFDKALESELFEEVKNPAENYYFYFDTGRVVSGSRGLALTNKSIIWKNLFGSISWRHLTGSATQLAFDKISSVTLVYERGIKSFTGWKLRLNEDDNYGIFLSKLSVGNVELFASAVVYFINIAEGKNLMLQVPEETRKLLIEGDSGKAS